MGFPAMDRGVSLEAQRYYAWIQSRYWLSVQTGWVDCPREDSAGSPRFVLEFELYRPFKGMMPWLLITPLPVHTA